MNLAVFINCFNSQELTKIFKDSKTTPKDMADFPHGVDERISIRSIELTQKAYYNIARKFLG
ncbi:MAG: hypothetical protein ACTSUI_07085 [Promethearchaeota archaeon]